MNKLNQTQKTFPRSLNECFKSTTDYACAVERPQRSSIAPFVIGLIIAITSVIVIVSCVKG
jgi:hypothetical protein